MNYYELIWYVFHSEIHFDSCALAKTVCSKPGPEGVALHSSAASHAAGRKTTGGQQANHLKNQTIQVPWASLGITGYRVYRLHEFVQFESIWCNLRGSCIAVETQWTSAIFSFSSPWFSHNSSGLGKSSHKDESVAWSLFQLADLQMIRSTSLNFLELGYKLNVKHIYIYTLPMCFNHYHI